MIIDYNELENNLEKYIEIALYEDVVVFKDGKPYIKLIDFFNNKSDVIDRLTGVIKLDKTYEELMDERYSNI